MQELSDDFGTAYGPFLLVGETVVSRQPKRDRAEALSLLPIYIAVIS